MENSIKSLFCCAIFAIIASGCTEPVQNTAQTAPSLVVVQTQNEAIVEGMQPMTLNVYANTVPFDKLHIAITADKPAQIELSEDTITGYLYPNPKTVQVRCLEDYRQEEPQEIDLTFTVTADDPDYNGMVVHHTITCVDNPEVPIVDDFCPDDPDKLEPGVCGCGVPDNVENTTIADHGYANCLNAIAAPDDVITGGFDIIQPDKTKFAEEGDEDVFAFALTQKPESDVLVTITSSDPTEGDVDIHEVIFTPENWDDPQIITVFSVDDDESDGNKTFSIMLEATSDDDMYARDVTASIALECIDNEPPVADVIFNTNNISVYEGSISADLFVQLATQPELTADGNVSEITVEFTSSNTKEALANPKRITFTSENWDQPQPVLVKGILDKEIDGNKNVAIEVKTTSNEACISTVCYNNREFAPIQVEVIDVDAPKHTGEQKTATIRIMAGNTSSGNKQSYDPGEGARIFRAFKPDIVLIQEFNYKKDTIRSFVTSTFGEEYHFVRGKGDIPNGIISRYPIIQSGAWESNQVTNRQWDWAVIDIPGDKELLAVSVHLHTTGNAAEMGPLRAKIDKKIASDNRDYYVVLGGDFNQPSWTPIRTNFASLFTVGKATSDWPIDQLGQITTNAKRNKQYDYLLCSHDFCKTEIPTVVGSHSYPKGHVVDSRVYSKKGELNDVAPMQAKDSGATNMQHMPVVRDFKITYTD